MEKVFAEWLILKSIDTQYGELQKLSVKVEEFKTFLDTYDTNWWVNLNLKKSREWKPYIELDTWVPDWEKKDNSNIKPMEWDSDISISDIPF